MTDLLIPKPCHQSWDAMTPRGDGRHCASCVKTVVDLTAMDAATGARALARIAAQVSAQAHICVRAPADAAGRIVLPDQAVAAPRRRPDLRRRLLTNGLAAVLAMVVAGDLAGAADDAAGTPVSASAPEPQVTRTPMPQDGDPKPGQPVAGPVTEIHGEVAAPPDGRSPATASATAATVAPVPHLQVVSGTVALPPPVKVRAPAPDQVRAPAPDQVRDAAPAPTPTMGEAQVGEPKVGKPGTGAADF